jgi:TPR repeat protein
MKRIEVNDPVAMCYMGKRCQIEGDYKGAFEYWDKAAELGNIEAHFNLSTMYRKGDGVERDKKKELHHLEQAAIGGDPDSRYNLGITEENNRRVDRAVRHWIIAAKLGHDGSLDALKDVFKRGLVSKEDFAAALRAHQTAVDATKSPQREAAEEHLRGRVP